MPTPDLPPPPYADYQHYLNSLPEATDKEKEKMFGPATQNKVAMPKTKEEFDALPHGTFYIEPEDGHIYQKGNKLRPRPQQAPKGMEV